MNTVAPETNEYEDTGKIFEMAICIEYKGKYKYGLEEPAKLSLKLVNDLLEVINDMYEEM